jgi:pimeloyl-ACP methyl ester carboxylesterase
LASGFAFDRSVSYGTYFSVVCGELAAHSTPELTAAAAASVRPEILAGVSENDLFASCSTWDVPAISAANVQPVQSNIPTLLMSGEYDPVTPASLATIAAQTLSNSHSFMFPGQGHGAFGSDPCPTSMVVAFVESPSVSPDSSCIGAMPPPVFVPPPGA